ncbi:MAG: cobyric acid synthase, partial [Chloroflexi bacterium]|nr:cobyric acid synthase [Chloroflexota bacterium]
AGSPAEVNLKDRDIVNMRVARYCQAPVLLVADIDRGGVFASIIGTLELLEPEERAMIKAVVINKFRGDPSLLTSGLRWLEERSGIPVAGLIPYYHDIHIAEEDSVSLEKRRAMRTKETYTLDIAVVGLPHISNFDDFDPLEQEEGVRLRYVEAHDSLGNPDLIILPGTKSTMADLDHLRRTGLAEELVNHRQNGTPVIGICGGYQMLGDQILDPQRVEGGVPQVPGLGLIPVATTFSVLKSTHQVEGRVVRGRGLLRNAADLPVRGYEIHMGQTSSDPCFAPLLIEERSRRPCQVLDGYLSVDGNVLGTYVHGLFHNEALRRAILDYLSERKGVNLRARRRVVSREEHYDKLAAHVRRALDMGLIYRTIGLDGT